MTTTTRSLVLCALVAASCSPEATVDAGPGAGDAGAGRDAGPPPPMGYDAGPITRRPEAAATAARAACEFGRGAFPEQTIGEEHSLGDNIPIERFVIVMMENRSFDHYFGAMPGVDGIPSGASNPDATGAPVAPFHTTDFCIADVRHSWNASHAQFNRGANDGFVTTNGAGGERALGYFDGTDLPFYWDLAQTFAFSDHHFCSVLGPTFVNRLYFLGASSLGRISNGSIDDARRPPGGGEYNIFMQLDRAGIEWRYYYVTAPAVWGTYPTYALHRSRRVHARPIEELSDDLASGDLPPVVYVDPGFEISNRIESSGEHPPANPQFGQAWVRELVTSVMASPVWRETALILTYDEHGGFYDHVPPPEACPPGDFPPDLEATSAVADFDRLGFRVPLYVISPWSRAGYVSDRVTDHTSVLRLIQARFDLPALTGRDANAWPMLDMFDFDDPPFMDPPTLADAPLEARARSQCAAAFPGGG